MTMLSLSRRLGITPRQDHDEYDPAAAGWLDSVHPEDAPQEAPHHAFVPQQWAGTHAVRDRERANSAADDHAAGGHGATTGGPRPVALAERPAEPQSIDQPAATPRPDGAWPAICDQFGSHLMVLTEQVRAALDVLEAGEDDPDRLKRLYQVDHAVTRMRLASRQLRTLAGRNEQRVAGFTTSLLDVIRMASAAIEWYPQVSVGPVVELAVLGYAADDVATLMSALLDNATRYSPDTVTVSCHLLEDGGVMLRVEDAGSGIGREQVTRLNAALAGPVPDVTESTARHTGFPVVHRLARKHSIGVRFASRNRPADGTVAMVLLPPQLLCAIPAYEIPRQPSADESADAAEPQTAASVAAEIALPDVLSPALLPPPVLPSAFLPAALLSAEAGSPEALSPEAVSPEAAQAEPDQDQPAAELPRRQPASVRLGQPRPSATAPPTQVQPPQAASRRAFADDLGAFSQGIQDALAARGITGGLVSALFDVPANRDDAASKEGTQS